MTHSGLRRPQLRTQVLVGVLTITLVALAAFDLAAVGALRQYLVGQTDSKLQTVLTLTQPRLEKLILAATSGLQPPAPVPGEYSIAFVPSHGKTVTLESGPGPARALSAAISSFLRQPPAGAGAPVQGRLPVPAGQVASTTRAGGSKSDAKRYTEGGMPGRVAAKTVTAGAAQYQVVGLPALTGTLVVTASLADVDATVGRFKAIVIAGSAATALIIFLGVVLVMRRGLRPIETMAAQADRISAGDLTDRVSVTGARSEVGRLGTALNGMLARIEAAVQEREASQQLMRRFFADASHELRNPLASLRANAELYQQGALRERLQVDEAMRRIRLEAQRMSRLVDDMLRLARLDQQPSRQHGPVDLAAVIDGCVQRAQVAHPGLIWRVRVDDDLVAAGDEELLRRAIDNLLANVCTHTPVGTLASVAAVSRDGQVVLDVSDDGPGVPDDSLSRIFDRFYRAGAPANRPGSGLGLAIVAEIVAAHQGRIEAMRNDPVGLRITLTLPAWWPQNALHGQETGP